MRSRVGEIFHTLVRDVHVARGRPRYSTNPPGLHPVPLCVMCMELFCPVINDLCFQAPGGFSSAISGVTTLFLKPLMKIEEIGHVRGGAENRTVIGSVCY